MLNVFTVIQLLNGEGGVVHADLNIQYGAVITRQFSSEYSQ